MVIGRVPHKAASYPGVHTPIVDADLFEAVQARLAETRCDGVKRVRDKAQRQATAPLRGHLFDADGSPMSPSFSRGRNPTRGYRYYVSTALQQGRKPLALAVSRISAPTLENLILERMSRWADTPELTWPQALHALTRIELHADTAIVQLHPRRLPGAPGQDAVATKRVVMRLQEDESLSSNQTTPGVIAIAVAIRIRRRGGKAFIVTPDGRPLSPPPRRDRTLIKALRSAQVLTAELAADPIADASALLHLRSAPSSYTHKLVGLAFLAPDIQDAILDGRHPSGLDLQRVMSTDLPLAWADQRTMLGFASTN